MIFSVDMYQQFEIPSNIYTLDSLHSPYFLPIPICNTKPRFESFLFNLLISPLELMLSSCLIL